MPAGDEVAYARISEDLDDNTSYLGRQIDPERPHSDSLPKSSTTTHTVTLVDGHPSRHHSAYGDVSYARSSIASSGNIPFSHESIITPGGRQPNELPNSDNIAHTKLDENGPERDRIATELQPVQWRISLYTPVSMISLFISGVLVAVGHHLFYARFHHTYTSEVNSVESVYLSQEWIIRYGTAFAFVAKTLLAGSVLVAYRQHMWITLRHKGNRLSTIDAVFAAPYDLLALLSPSMFLKAKIATLMALLAWCLPLAAIITPSTLSINHGMLGSSSSTQVPTLNLNNVTLYRAIGFHDDTSPLINRLTLATAAGMQILPMRPTLPEGASYKHTFDAPSLKCEAATGYRLSNISAMVNETRKQLSITRDILMEDVGINYLSVLLREEDFNSNSSVDVFEYISHCVVDTRADACKRELVGAVLLSRMGNESITCAVHNTQYTISVRIPDPARMEIWNVTFESKERTEDPVALHLFDALTSLLNGFFGTISAGDTGKSYISGQTMIANTALLELLQESIEPRRSAIPQEEWMHKDNRTFAQMIEELSRNQTLSLFSNDKFWVPMANATRVEYGKTQEGDAPEYWYDPVTFWIAYGIAIASSLAAVIVGLRALWINGVSHDNSFSSIMATTRNTYLDELTMGHSLGATPASKEILRTKLRFGRLDGGIKEKLPRAGFGLPESVQTLGKGQSVY